MCKPEGMHYISMKFYNIKGFPRECKLYNENTWRGYTKISNDSSPVRMTMNSLITFTEKPIPILNYKDFSNNSENLIWKLDNLPFYNVLWSETSGSKEFPVTVGKPIVRFSNKWDLLSLCTCWVTEQLPNWSTRCKI